jgi:hypothetical protein
MQVDFSDDTGFWDQRCKRFSSTEDMIKDMEVGIKRAIDGKNKSLHLRFCEGRDALFSYFKNHGVKYGFGIDDYYSRDKSYSCFLDINLDDYLPVLLKKVNINA